MVVMIPTLYSGSCDHATSSMAEISEIYKKATIRTLH